MAQYYNDDGTIGLRNSPSKKQLNNVGSSGSLGIVEFNKPLLNQPPVALNQQYIYYQQEQNKNRSSLNGQGLTEAINETQINRGQKGIQMEVRPN